MTYLPIVMPSRQELAVVGLVTLQFSWGGLCDWSPAADDFTVHLVREADRGRTPGPTLCDINRFDEGGPGWSVAGGISGPGIEHTPCQGCAAAARRDYPDLPIRGLGTPQIVACIAGTEEGT